VSEGAAAAVLREDLVNWEFNPFTGDTSVKCGMLEAMFHRLGLSQVTRRMMLHTHLTVYSRPAYRVLLAVAAQPV
jgi:hypothetical protein